ncbi:MAG: FkbM family methyltransferase [Ferruginibacter sp.]
MPVTGKRRYLNLFENILNPQEYIFKKGKRHKTPLLFTTRPNKISFDVPDSLYYVFKEIFMEDVYDINQLVLSLPENPVVVDIGANAGFFDIILLSKISKAKIFAYEPLPSNLAYFKKIIKNNPAIEPYISVFQAAVTGVEKTAMDLFMEDSSESQVVASAIAGFNFRNTKKITVPCISLSKIVETNQLQHIDLLKIDCEGSEYDILYNTPASVLQMARHIAIEVHDIDTESFNFSTLKKYLESLNYTMTYTPINDFCFAVDAVLNS